MNLIGFTENVSNRKVQQGDGAKEEETEPSLGSMTEKETGSGNDFLAASVRKTKQKSTDGASTLNISKS